MRTSNWKIFIFIIILAFGLTFNAVCTSYSQGDDYLTSYSATYYPTRLFTPSGIQIPTYSYSSLYDMSPYATLARRRAMSGSNMFYTQTEQFIPLSIYYSGMMYGYSGLNNSAQDFNPFLTNDPLIIDSIFNQIYSNYQSIVNPVEMFNHSYTHLSETPNDQHYKLSIQKCLHEREDLDTRQCMVLHGDPGLSVSAERSLGYPSLGFPPAQLSAIPSIDYLSIYFLCFEGP